MTNRRPVSRRALLAGAAATVSAPILATPHLARAAPSPLVIYNALDFVDSAARAFTAKTGTPVNRVELGGTGGVLGKIAAEGDRPQFDVVWLEGSAVMERMGQAGILGDIGALALPVAYTRTGRALVPASGRYLPTTVSTTSVTVNTSKLPADQMPAAWADLAAPAYRDLVAAKDPNLSGPAFQWLAGFFQVMGEEKGKALLLEVLTNKALSGLPSGGQVNKALLTGKAALAITQDSASYAKIAAGEPLAVVYPREGVVATPSSVGVSARTANADAARAFVAFVLSPEGQAAMLDGEESDFFFIPLIEGVAAKPGRRADFAMVLVDNAAAAAHEAAWKGWFREHFVP